MRLEQALALHDGECAHASLEDIHEEASGSLLVLMRSMTSLARRLRIFT